MTRTAILVLAGLLAATPIRAAEPPRGDRYADGRDFAGPALDELLSRDNEGEAADVLDPDGPTDCMLRIAGAPIPA